MKKYDVFLFDADETLFDFLVSERAALGTMLESIGVAITDVILSKYRDGNNTLWEKFQKQEITIDELQAVRFTQVINEIKQDLNPVELNTKYLVELAKCAHLTEGAEEICEKITSAGKSVYIITNGITVTQESRLSRSKINKYISGMFISEAVGHKKPDPEYFAHVCASIPHKDKSKMLVVGDSLTADIAGGNAVGIDTCWFNQKNETNRTAFAPVMEISKLLELSRFV